MEKKSIFISHAFDDRLIADRLIDKLIIPICLLDKEKDIFYTSKRITGIKPSLNWKEKIKTTIKTCDIFIAIITPNYRKSEMCIGEIGAAWILEKKIYPLIIPPISFNDFNIIVSELQAENLLKFDNVESLINSLKRDVTRLFGNSDFSDNNQDVIIKRFIKSLRQYLRKKPFHEVQTTNARSIIIENENHDQENEYGNQESIEETEEMKIIKEQSLLEWPDDYSMQLHYINEQKSALKELKRTIANTSNPDLIKIIYNKAKSEWPKDFSMQLHVLKEQIKAYKRLK